MMFVFILIAFMSLVSLPLSANGDELSDMYAAKQAASAIRDAAIHADSVARELTAKNANDTAALSVLHAAKAAAIAAATAAAVIDLETRRKYNIRNRTKLPMFPPAPASPLDDY